MVNDSKNEDEDIKDVEIPEEEEQEEFDQEELDEDLFDEDFLSEELEETEQLEEKEEGAEEQTEAPPPKAPVQEKTIISPKDIPLQLVVEIGQIPMTIAQLMQLEPGNMLEVDIPPESCINLTIQGKYVGKGELIRIGEAIGVRILEMGQE